MKQFFLIFAAMIGFAICTDAQTLNNDGKLYVVNDTFYMNGIPVSDGELVMLLGEDLYNGEYLKAKKKLQASNVLGYIGGTLVGTGVGCAAGNAISTLAYGGTFRARPYIVYGCITVAGLIPSLIHFNMNKKGRDAFNRIAATYNKNTGKVMELTVSPASNGFGIALNF